MFWRRNHRQTEPKDSPTRMFGKTILAIADIHVNQIDVPDCNPDVVLFLGDIPFQMVEKLDKLYSCPKLGVLGNHDGPDYLDGTSILNIYAQVVEVAGLRFAGFGGAPRYNGKSHGQYTEDEARAFADGLEYVDVFLAHANPQWVADASQDPVDAGFQALAEYINRAQPAHFFHGHIHERYEKQVHGTMVHSVYQAQIIAI